MGGNTSSVNAESDLDLEYSMNLVTVKQAVTLYQIGDPVAGLNSCCITFLLSDREQGHHLTTSSTHLMVVIAVSRVAMTQIKMPFTLIPSLADIMVRTA